MCRECLTFSISFNSKEFHSLKIDNRNKSTSEALCRPFCIGVVPEQAGKIPAERAELGDEPGCLRRQRNGDRATATSYQGVASSAASDREQRGIVTGRSCYHSSNSAVFLRRLLANDAAALRGANRRDRRLSRFRCKRRPGEHEPAAIPPSSGRYPSRHSRRNRCERPERPEAASASLWLNVSSDAREYVTLSPEIESSKRENVTLKSLNM